MLPSRLLPVVATLALGFAYSSHSFAQGQLYVVAPDAQFPIIASDIAALDDVNGDGVRDWIEGAYSGARVHSGLDGAVLYSYPSSLVGASFGSLVLGLEDIDGDGVGDFLIGGSSVDADFERSGAVYVFSGRQGTLIRTHSGTEVGGGFGASGAALRGGAGFPAGGFYAIGEQGSTRVRVFASYSGSEVYSLTNPNPFSNFGLVVVNAGDQNMDGYDDLAVSFGVFPARVQVFAGGNFQAPHPLLLELTDERFQGPFGGGGDYTYFGRTLASLGDINGDGVADLAVGAFLEGNGFGRPEGRVRAFDGATGAVLWARSGETARFASSVEPTGDHDGDGIQDVLVGGPGYQGSAPEGGSAFSPPQGSVSLLSGADGRLLSLFRGRFGFDSFGSIAASVGDLTGDGIPEIAIPSFGSPETELRIYRGDLCPQPREYCVSLPNSQTSAGSSDGARRSSSGSVQLGSNDLVLWVSGAPWSQTGAFFLGANPVSLPVADGILCIGGPRRLLAPVNTNPSGLAILEIGDLPGQPFQVGESVFAQYVFRDPNLVGGTGLNFSTGLSMTFCP